MMTPVLLFTIGMIAAVYTVASAIRPVRSSDPFYV